MSRTKEFLDRVESQTPQDELTRREEFEAQFEAFMPPHKRRESNANAPQQKEHANEREKERLLTPVGEAKWAHLHTPKSPFKDESGKEKGNPRYQIDVVFDPEQPDWKVWAKLLQEKIRALPEETKKSTGEKLPKQQTIKRELNEADEPTGRYYATFKTGESFKPGVFDRYGKPIPANVLIGNGSKVRVSYTEQEYDAFGGGITLYLSAVQVVELVEYGNRSAEDYGFSVEDAPPDAELQSEPLDDMPF